MLASSHIISASSAMVLSVNLPRAVLSGGGSVSRLGGLLTNMGLKRPLVVTDRFLASPESGAVSKVVDAMTSTVSSYDVFTDTIPDPTTDSVERCVAALASGKFDSIVALGGGSPMDTAKAAGVLHKHGGKMRDYKAPFSMDEESLPIVAVPTTAGTGSEVTRFTIITDSETDEKMLCIGLAYLPIAAILDYEVRRASFTRRLASRQVCARAKQSSAHHSSPSSRPSPQLTLTKPFRLTADAGIDAIAHAVEAYVSAKRNPFSDGMAISAMTKLGRSLYSACHNPTDGLAREQMLIGGTATTISPMARPSLR